MKKLMVILVVLMTSATAWGQSNPWKPVKDAYIMNEMEQSLADSMAEDVNEMYGRIDEVKIVRVRCEQDQREPMLWRATLWIDLGEGFGIHTIHMMGIEGGSHTRIRWEMSGYSDENRDYPIGAAGYWYGATGSTTPAWVPCDSSGSAARLQSRAQRST